MQLDQILVETTFFILASPGEMVRRGKKLTVINIGVS